MAEIPLHEINEWATRQGAQRELKNAILKAICTMPGADRTNMLAVLGRLIEHTILEDAPTLRVALERVADFSRTLKENVRHTHHVRSRLRK